MRAFVLLLVSVLACASAGDPMRYRLAGTGTHWSDGAGRTVVADLCARYPEFFQVVLDPTNTREPDLRPLRHDIEHAPVDRRNFDRESFGHLI